MGCFTAAELVFKLETQEPFGGIRNAMLAKLFYFQNHKSSKQILTQLVGQIRSHVFSI